ncbi:MAG: nucleotidyl transferase AbiEii/AbiGii toxin family protein [Acidimicrobiaceae bacterium]|nr:nucleotidyl transferase AbiEii/AbiGii toxin family protein [Acidimicrobiaceae bacterium]MCY4279288.1 nucleotidyl transferase AbiEii/AbiGii toxin family protein [Acidimicrobiaceae bacterium]
MPEIDRYGQVLSRDLRAAWPVVAATVNRLKGVVVGGTALATVLQHRQSFDIDYQTTTSFSGRHLARKLARVSASHELSCSIRQSEDGILDASINGVDVQIFRVLFQGKNPGYVKQIAAPVIIDGLAVASLPDLLAMKLDVIMYRPKLRDYIDIAAIDQSRRFTIEDGLNFHAQRYGTAEVGHDTTQILRLLKSPGRLSADRVFDHSATETLAYLKHRAEQVSQALDQQRTPEVIGKNKRPPTLPIASLQTADHCNVWMPIAQTRCQLPKGHQGHHRSQAN